MNKGASKSTGEWLYFIGSGDTLKEDTVLKEVFTKNYSDKISIISGQIVYEGKTKPFILKNDTMIKKPSWNALIWVRNSLHHQGSFYRKQLFFKYSYSLKYPVFSDYWFNILLFKKGCKCILTDVFIAKCNSYGVSKTGSWSNYKEELKLKTDLSSKLLTPFFYILIAVKFFLRQLAND